MQNSDSFRLTSEIKIIILAVIVWNVITAWDEVVDRLFFKWTGLDKESVRSWLLLAVILTILGLLVLYYLNIRFSDILGTLHM